VNWLTKKISNMSNTSVLIIVLLFAVSSGAVSFSIRASTSASEWGSSILQNFATEMLGAFLTFILIDLVIGGREKRESEAREERRRLLRQLTKRLRSPNNEIAAFAAEELRRQGWLDNGSLENAYLSYANLRGVDLTNADLEGARLTKAKLHGAYLSKANLEGTTLTVAQLAQAYSLLGTIMPDGREYDGRLNLEGDVYFARENKVDVNDPISMAQFLGVSLEDYLKGQEWSMQNLDRLREGATSSDETAWWHK
jgi:pentapeptide repeat protein